MVLGHQILVACYPLFCVHPHLIYEIEAQMELLLILFFFLVGDNSLILHIYTIIRKHYHTYFELIHAFYSWFWNNAEKSILCLIEF